MLQQKHFPLLHGLVFPAFSPKAKLFARTNFRRSELPVRFTKLKTDGAWEELGLAVSCALVVDEDDKDSARERAEECFSTTLMIGLSAP